MLVLFYCRGQTQVLMLAGQVLYRLGLLPDPTAPLSLILWVSPVSLLRG